LEFLLRPVTVAAPFKAWTEFARSHTGIVGSNPTQSMDVHVRLFCVCVVLCVGSGLAKDWSPSKQSYRLCIGFFFPWPLVRKRTIPTERLPHVGEVSANFCG
jgi:hypothetical protein